MARQPQLQLRLPGKSKASFPHSDARVINLMLVQYARVSGRTTGLDSPFRESGGESGRLRVVRPGHPAYLSGKRGPERRRERGVVMQWLSYAISGQV